MLKDYVWATPRILCKFSECMSLMVALSSCTPHMRLKSLTACHQHSVPAVQTCICALKDTIEERQCVIFNSYAERIFLFSYLEYFIH